MKTILVPTDFSEAARNAAIYAAELAKNLEYKLILYHAYHVPVMASTPENAFIIAEPRELDITNKKRIKKEGAFIAKKCDINAECLTSEGFAEDEILALEKELKPDLIIMGMKTIGALDEYILGSIATDIIRKAQTPVIIVPEKARYKKISKIVFATEHRKEDGTIIRGVTKEIAQVFGSKIYVLNVVKENKLAEVGKEFSQERLKQYFEEVEHTHHFLEDNDLIHGLNEFIMVHKISMIVMTPHKHTLLSRIFKEPNTKKMAFHTSIPLLTLPAEI